MSKEKRPSYFRFFIEACDMISLLDIESAGRVIHCVTVFNRIRRDVDKSFSEYAAAVSFGKAGAEKRHGVGGR